MLDKHQMKTTMRKLKIQPFARALGFYSMTCYYPKFIREKEKLKRLSNKEKTSKDVRIKRHSLCHPHCIVNFKGYTKD